MPKSKVNITVDRDVYEALRDRGFSPSALSNKYLRETLERQMRFEAQEESSLNPPKKEAIAP